MDDYDKYWNEKRTKFMKSFNKMFKPTPHDVEREDIGGLEQILGKLDTFQQGIEYPQLYEMMGVRPPNGFILAGKPGTGKTMIAKYLSESLDARFVGLALNKFESMFVGQASKKLKENLDWFRRHYQVMDRKVLLFFDEADEVLKRRDSQGWHGPRVNLLLREMDGLGENEGIIFGAATNHLDKVDPAVMRAGRLDYVIEMPDYDASMLGDVYRSTAKRLNRKSPVHHPYSVSNSFIERLGDAAHRKGLVPSDINEIFRLAAEDKIKKVIDEDPENLYDARRLSVGGSTLLKHTNNYTRPGADKRGKLGF